MGALKVKIRVGVMTSTRGDLECEMVTRRRYLVGGKSKECSRSHQKREEVHFCKADPKELHRLKLERKRMILDEQGVLVRKNGERNHQIVLPESMRNMTYKHLHVDMGHHI